MVARIIGCCVIVSLWNCGCGTASGTKGFTRVPPADVKQTNEVRRTHGIREISPKWEFYDRENSEEKWHWPRQDGAGHLCKKVMRDAEDRITWEEDYYPSGASFPSTDGTGFESLTIHYDYGSKSFSIGYVGIDPMARSVLSGLRSTSAGYVANDNEATLKAADAILAMWALSRL